MCAQGHSLTAAPTQTGMRVLAHCMCLHTVCACALCVLALCVCLHTVCDCTLCVLACVCRDTQKVLAGVSELSGLVLHPSLNISLDLCPSIFQQPGVLCQSTGDDAPHLAGILGHPSVNSSQPSQPPPQLDMEGSAQELPQPPQQQQQHLLSRPPSLVEQFASKHSGSSAGGSGSAQDPPLTLFAHPSVNNVRACACSGPGNQVLVEPREGSAPSAMCVLARPGAAAVGAAAAAGHIWKDAQKSASNHTIRARAQA